MNKWTFRPINRDTPDFFSANVQDYLAEVHLARFIVGVVEQLDLTPFTTPIQGKVAC